MSITKEFEFESLSYPLLDGTSRILRITFEVRSWNEFNDIFVSNIDDDKEIKLTSLSSAEQIKIMRKCSDIAHDSQAELSEEKEDL